MDLPSIARFGERVAAADARSRNAQHHLDVLLQQMQAWHPGAQANHIEQADLALHNASEELDAATRTMSAALMLLLRGPIPAPSLSHVSRADYTRQVAGYHLLSALRTAEDAQTDIALCRSRLRSVRHLLDNPNVPGMPASAVEEHLHARDDLAAAVQYVQELVAQTTLAVGAIAAAIN